ncbi:MAG: hypothetical protein AAF439_12975, partial [Pseudomonadota bacterium]
RPGAWPDTPGPVAALSPRSGRAADHRCDRGRIRIPGHDALLLEKTFQLSMAHDAPGERR